MFFVKTEEETTQIHLDTPLVITLLLTVLGTIALGLYPEPVISFAREAVAGFIF